MANCGGRYERGVTKPCLHESLSRLSSKGNSPHAPTYHDRVRELQPTPRGMSLETEHLLQQGLERGVDEDDGLQQHMGDR